VNALRSLLPGFGVVGAFVLGACVVDTSSSPDLGEVEQHAGSVCATHATTLKGIDVSRFQGTIDWTKVKGDGVVYAWIQISRSLTDIDMKFDYNWSHAKSAGVLRGAYQRFHPGQDVIAQADLFLQKLGPYQPGDLPPMLDVEDSDGLSAAKISAAVRQWMDHVEPVVGVKPIIYTGFYFWRDSAGSPDFSTHPLWIANYGATCPLVPDHWTKWAFHQYSSSGSVNGIAGAVDMDKFDGTLADLMALGQPAKPISCDDVIPADGGVVDDTNVCFKAGGDPMYIRHENGGYGSSLQWTGTTANANPANYGIWNLTFAEAGKYRVEVYLSSPFNESKMAKYKITHGGGMTDAVTIDQGAATGWVSLGELDFDAGGDGQQIRLDDNTGEPGTTMTSLELDAVRLTRLDNDMGSGSGSGDPDPGTPGDIGGCNTSGGGASAGLMLGFAAMLTRRRRTR
jgi:lysozyme